MICHKVKRQIEFAPKKIKKVKTKISIFLKKEKPECTFNTLLSAFLFVLARLIKHVLALIILSAKARLIIFESKLVRRGQNVK